MSSPGLDPFDEYAGLTAASLFQMGGALMVAGRYDDAVAPLAAAVIGGSDHAATLLGGLTGKANEEVLDPLVQRVVESDHVDAAGDAVTMLLQARATGLDHLGVPEAALPLRYELLRRRADRADECLATYTGHAPEELLRPYIAKAIHEGLATPLMISRRVAEMRAKHLHGVSDLLQDAASAGIEVASDDVEPLVRTNALFSDAGIAGRHTGGPADDDLADVAPVVDLVRSSEAKHISSLRTLAPFSGQPARSVRRQSFTIPTSLLPRFSGEHVRDVPDEVRRALIDVIDKFISLDHPRREQRRAALADGLGLINPTGRQLESIVRAFSDEVRAYGAGAASSEIDGISRLLHGLRSSESLAAELVAFCGSPEGSVTVGQQIQELQHSTWTSAVAGPGSKPGNATEPSRRVRTQGFVL